MSESSSEVQPQPTIRSAMPDLRAHRTRRRTRSHVTVQAGYVDGRWTGTSAVMVNLREQVRLPLADVELLLVAAGCQIHEVSPHHVSASPSVAVYDALAAAGVAFDLLDTTHSRGGPAGQVVPWPISPCRDVCEGAGCHDQASIDALNTERDAL